MHPEVQKKLLVCNTSNNRIPHTPHIVCAERSISPQAEPRST